MSQIDGGLAKWTYKIDRSPNRKSVKTKEKKSNEIAPILDGDFKEEQLRISVAHVLEDIIKKQNISISSCEKENITIQAIKQIQDINN